MMKKLKFLFAALAMVATMSLVSCSSDDDPQPEDPQIEQPLPENPVVEQPLPPAAEQPLPETEVTPF